MNRLRMGLAAAACLAFVAVLAGTHAGWAGEADDLQRMIDVHQQGMSDLERLDERRAVREDITMLRVWLELAWKLRSEQKYDEVRTVLDRCDAQTQMIRDKIAASKVVAEAQAKEAELANARDKIAKTKQALQAALLEKASLEGRTK